MKKSQFYLPIIAILCLFLVSCGVKDEPKNLWESATYIEDAELGTGEKTVTVDVSAEDKTVKLTINTDKETLGDALLEHSLISGEQGPYGLYVKVVNGITADYETTKSYWSLNKNGEYMNAGVDSTEISDGDKFQLVYTKAE